jgi:hypothetical protein
MKLTLFTDYAMRTPLLSGRASGATCSIGEVAQAYRISQNHLMKVVVELVRSGHVESVRDGPGGIRLGMPPEDHQCRRCRSAHRRWLRPGRLWKLHRRPGLRAHGGAEGGA